MQSNGDSSVKCFWADRRVTVMGLGEFGGGIAAVRFLAEQNAILTVTDLRTEKELQSSLEQIADLSICKFQLGEHNENDFSDADAIVVNPAVKPGNRFVGLAKKNDALITTELGLFLNQNRGRVIAVTGTNGKSTTSTLIHSILSQTEHRCWLGGNIGGSLLDSCDEISADDYVILEISSFQLHWLKQSGISLNVDIAVITNFHPNHLDWHNTTEKYRAAKQFLLESQSEKQFAILNSNDAECWNWSTSAQKIDSQDYETLVEPLSFDKDHRSRVHQQENILTAVAIAKTVGVSDDRIEKGICDFQGLPHRLEEVGEFQGRQFVDDSQATTPESTIYALHFLEKPIILFAGGADKGADLSGLSQAIFKHAKAVVLMGETGPILKRHLENASCTIPMFLGQSFEDCFQWAWEQSQQGDVLLLSPGCASAGWFRNYRDRSEQFRAERERLRL